LPDLKELKDQMTKRSVEAQTVVNDEKMTMPEKREALDKIEVDLKAFSEQIKDIEYLDEKRKQYVGAGDIETAPAEKHEPKITGKTISDQLLATAEFKSVNDPGRPATFTTGPVELKTTLTETTAGGTAGSGLAQPQVLPGILPILFQRLTVQDLMPGGQTGNALVRYLKETAATNAAAAVAEGAAKPASTLVYSAVDEPVRKIATTLKVTDELFADVPALRSYIDNRLMLFVEMATEAALVSGAGAPSLTGILQRSGLTAAQAKGADTAIDAIYKDITKIRVASFLEPDAIVVHPTDWQGIRLLKDSNNQYFGGGPFTGAYGNGGGMAPDMLWGKRVVVTTAITVGTALVGAFATAAQVFSRGGLTVEATNSNEDDFLNNLIALRAEQRLALAVYRPGAFSTVTGL
jgi:HK97 family phage major capsid protein